MTTFWMKLVQRNMGAMEASLRVVVGAVLVMLALVIPNPWCWLGLYPLGTGLLCSSPLYTLLGIETKRLGY
jgi:hypothetical protein